MILGDKIHFLALLSQILVVQLFVPFDGQTTGVFTQAPVDGVQESVVQ
jgi:hypothetical protein